MEMELLDSLTGVRLAAAIDRRDRIPPRRRPAGCEASRGPRQAEIIGAYETEPRGSIDVKVKKYF